MKTWIPAALLAALMGGIFGFSGFGQAVLGGMWMDMDPDFQVTDVSVDEAFDAAEYYAYVDPPPDIADAIADGARLIYPPKAFPNDDLKIAWVTELTGTGFLVTSAFKEFEPLVVYSTESEFPWDVDPQNALREVLLCDLALRLLARFFGEGGCEVDWHLDSWDGTVGGIVGSAVASLAHVLTGTPPYEGPDPMIRFDNNWHQDDPCNAKCGGQPTGCVPLAMAQIIYHYEYPTYLEAPGLVTRWYYAGLPNCGNQHVQDLCYRIRSELGVGPDGGASLEDAAESLSDVWKYGSPEPGHYWGSEIAENYFALLCGDLLEGRPSILNLKGISETTFETTFHAVVCDGYKVQQEHGAQLTRAFHLRMGNKAGGTTVWYSLPTDCFPPNYNALREGVLRITPPTSAYGTSCSLALGLNTQDGHYGLLQWVNVTADAGHNAAANLYAFSALLPGLWTGVSWNIPAGEGRQFPIPWFTLNPGVETIVLWADMGACTRVLARTYVIGPDRSLIDGLEVTGAYSPSTGTASVRYDVTQPDCEVYSVRAYLISPQRGLEDIGSSTDRSGTFTRISLQDTGVGEHIIVIAASTSAGALSKTYAFVVN